MAHFTPNRKFRRKYDRLFKRDPLAANTFLLLCELADAKGRVQTTPKELAALLPERFENPEARQI